LGAKIVKVLVPYEDAEIIKTIQSILGDEAEVVVSSRDPEAMIKAGGDAVAVASGRVPGEYIRAASNLRMIQAFGAGIDKIDHEAVREHEDIVVCNSHANAAEVSEYTIMLLLAAAKNIIVSDRELRKGDWSRGWGGSRPNIEIRGKTCLLIGLGNVASAIAERLKPFGVQLHAVTHTGSSAKTNLVDKISSIKHIERAVRGADFVILALPLTNYSKGLVDERFLSWMKPSSILINISRGPIVDEAALYAALAEGRIGGAALDVWWKYPHKRKGTINPPSNDFAFHELDNVVLSPHRAAYSEGIMNEQIRFVGENILRFIRGEKPWNVVDMNLGY
jgi:phosphoglycerate dehydrogenase-like enzyme